MRRSYGVLGPLVTVAGLALLLNGCQRLAKARALEEAAARQAAAERASFEARAAAEDNKDAAWGTIKGRVVFGGDTVPERKQVNVTKDQEHCLSKGPLLSDELVVNKKNKGVRWAFVWLLPAKDGDPPLPVHPGLKEIKKTEVEIDQPCCQFVPHAVGIRQGQEIVAKNSAPVQHNVHWIGGLKNGDGNVIVPAGQSYTIKGLVANRLPVKLSCDIHGWMSGWIRIFDHAYFAVTDEDGKFEIKLAPAGKFRLMVWQETVGYIPAGARNGTPIEIKGGDSTDQGEIKMQPPDEK